MTARRRATRSALRFVASVLMTSGVLLLADAGVTLAWQEPVSAFLAAREQDQLEDELEDQAALTERDRRAVLDIQNLPLRIRRLAELQKARTGKGDPIGKIKFRSRDYVVVQGDDTETLRKGPGHYPKTEWPGEAGTVAIAGHRTTYGAPFRTLDKLDRGDSVVLEMPYARFTYRVEREQIVPPSATWVTRDTDHERLVLSACHPLYSAAKRIVIFARLERAEES
jgi:sortase A